MPDMPSQNHPITPSASAAIAIAACAFTVANSEQQTDGRVWMQVTPAQDFLPSDGREMDVPTWRIDEVKAQRVIAALAATTTPPVVDYEHQTLHKETNGQPAPAAGWIHGLRWVKDKGLYALVELTARAAGMIASREYLYFSPVFEYSKKTGDVTKILMGALTNYPAIHGMDAVTLQAAATARFTPTNLDHKTEKEPPVNPLLKALLSALNLPETTTEEAAVAAATARIAAGDAAIAALKLDATASADTVTAACTSLTARATTAATPDPAKYVPISVVADLQTNVAALTAKVHETEADTLIKQGIDAAKLVTPKLQEHARHVAKTSGIAALTAFIDALPEVAALKGTQTQGKPPAGATGNEGASGLNADELAVAAACGLTPEAFAAGKA